MKMKMLMGVVLALSLILAGGSAAYAMAFANASVTINSIGWQGFALGGGQAPTLSWGAGGSAYADSLAWNEGTFYTYYWYGPNTPMTATVGGTTSSAVASYASTFNPVSSPFSASASAVPGPSYGGYALAGYLYWNPDPNNSTTFNYSNYSSSPFTISGSGVVQFTINYTMSANGAVSNQTEYSAWDAYLQSEMNYSGNNGNGQDLKYDEITGEVGNQGTSGAPGTVTGTFTLTEYFNGGEQGQLNLSSSVYAYVYSNSPTSPVPLPPTLLLFAPGLFGLAAIRKRLHK